MERYKCIYTHTHTRVHTGNTLGRGLTPLLTLHPHSSASLEALCQGILLGPAADGLEPPSTPQKLQNADKSSWSSKNHSIRLCHQPSLTAPSSARFTPVYLHLSWSSHWTKWASLWSHYCHAAGAHPCTDLCTQLWDRPSVPTEGSQRVAMGQLFHPSQVTQGEWPKCCPDQQCPVPNQTFPQLNQAISKTPQHD